MDQFELALRDTIAAARLPADVCEWLQLNNDLKIIRPDWLRRLVLRFNSRSLAWLSLINRVDLLGPARSERCFAPADPLAARTKFSLLLQQLQGDTVANVPARGRKTWPWFVLAVYCAGLIWLTFCAYFHYVHDANIVRLEKLTAVRQEESISRLQDVELVQRDIQSRADAARTMLKRLGASHIEWPFIMQIILAILAQTVNWLVVFPWRARRNRWLLLTALAILEPAEETQTRARLTLDELRRFESDSLLFGQAKLERAERDLAVILEANGRDDTVSKLDQLLHRVLALRWHREHVFLVGQVKAIALAGRLNPLNRTRACRDWLALFQLVTTSTLYIYLHLLLALVYLGLRAHFGARNRNLHFDSWRDVLSSVNLVVLVEICAISAVFASSIYSSALFDQLVATTRTRSLIMSVVRSNARKFDELLQSAVNCRPGTKSSSLVTRRRQADSRRLLTTSVVLSGRACALTKTTSHRSQRLANYDQLKQAMELDLVMVLIQYRLQLRAFELAKEPVRRVAEFGVNFAIVLPIVLFVHGAYFDWELRRIILCGASGTILCCMLALAPLALFHRRSLRTYESVWTLLGQLSHFEAWAQLSGHLEPSSSVALFQLRRLVSDSHSTREQLSFRVHWLLISYTNLIRLFTYILIFMLAGGVLTSRLLGDRFEDIAKDPLRLLKFF